MKWIRTFAVTACLSPACLFAQAAVPESPAIWREVTGVIKNYSGATYLNSSFTRPHMPGLRT
ncbi:MAG: hypothetical protein U0984_10150, partial [Prosthecobacter sp.]|nr:hypothetical protein [Prosthecobacter sp.]